MTGLLHGLTAYYTGPEWLILPSICLFLAGFMLRSGRYSYSCYFSFAATISLLGFPSVYF